MCAQFAKGLIIIIIIIILFAQKAICQSSEQFNNTVSKTYHAHIMRLITILLYTYSQLQFIYTCTGWAKLNGANLHFCL